MSDFSFTVIRELGTIFETKNGRSMKMRVISWNGNAPRVDLRIWNGDTPFKGITLTTEDARAIRDILNNMDLGAAEE